MYEVQILITHERDAYFLNQFNQFLDIFSARTWQQNLYSFSVKKYVGLWNIFSYKTLSCASF